MRQKEEKTIKRNQWHHAFYAGIQIEFREEKDKLIFESEHQLGTKPTVIDALIIRKHGKEPIQKNIGRIFREHNIIEYKSPDDYISVDDFYKVYAYACFYKCDTQYENQIDAGEVTITLVSHGYPRELVRHLKEVRGYTVEKEDAGIYYVKGDFIPIQLLVTRELSGKENLWLKSLTNRIETREEIEEIYEEYAKHENEKLYSAIMDIIVKANSRKFEVEDMCEALEEIYMKKAEPKIREREEVSKVEGKIEQIIEMGREFGLSEEEILNRLQTKLELPFDKAEQYLKQYSV